MPKKGNNIYLRKDGRWEGRYPKDKMNGKTRYGYIFGKTFGEVESKINEIAAYSSKLSTDSGTSFESLSMEWLVAQKRLFFMICVNTENGIKYRMVIGLVSRKAVYRP